VRGSAAQFRLVVLNRGSLQALTEAYDLTGRIQRAWDWSVVSLELGIELGAALFSQRFETPGRAPSRLTFAPLIAPRMSFGLDFGGGYFGAIDASAETYLLRTQAPREDARLTAQFALRTSIAFGKRLYCVVGPLGRASAISSMSPAGSPARRAGHSSYRALPEARRRCIRRPISRVGSIHLNFARASQRRRPHPSAAAPRFGRRRSHAALRSPHCSGRLRLALD